MDIYLHSPLGDPMRRWPMRNAAHGPIQVEYPLGDPTLSGKWTVVASARSSSRVKFTKKIEVVDYRPIGFEVEVELASRTVVAGDDGISGAVRAFSTIGGVPIKGMLNIQAVMTTDGPGDQPECRKKIYFVRSIIFLQ